LIRGEDINNNSDLPSIPPINGRIGLRFQAFRWIRTEIVANLFDNQLRVADGESATKGYSYYDFRISSSELNTGFGKLSIYGGIENITNRAYINHLASNRGFIKYEPGRNFYIRVRLDI
jgi:hemoglobin/transferrin/lactoferrin receptor protein